MNGYEFCESILEHPEGGVQALLDIAGDNECEWLELKASTQLLPEDQKRGAKPEDLYWSIANAVIGLMNTYGGAVIIGIEDKTHKYVPLHDFHGNLIKSKDEFEPYLRKVYEKIWDDNSAEKKDWGTEKKFHSKKSPPSKLVEMRSYPYDKDENERVAVILVKPANPCFHIWRDQVEHIRIRVGGEMGKTKEIIGSDNMADYEEKGRKLDASFAKFAVILKQFKKRVDKDAQKRKTFWLVTSIIALLIALFFLFFTVIPTVIIDGRGIKPIPGKRPPDQFIVEHPLPTIEWCRFNHKVWWVVSDSVNTCYGTWELQRNKVFSNFRIVDPRNIMRCWGTQKMVVPIFNKLKIELEKECPPLNSPSKSPPLVQSILWEACLPVLLPPRVTDRLTAV